ncbi:MAG: YbaB/EbfC family nucleoid-associated protein [Nocardioides sp.]
MSEESVDQPGRQANPLEALGLGGSSDGLGGGIGGAGGGIGGGIDMELLLHQAQQMQPQLQQTQRTLAESTVEGSAGGGAVTVTVSGVGDLKAVAIKPGGFDGNNAEDLADLGDLVVAAYRDAKVRADAKAAETLEPMTQLLGGGVAQPGAAAPGADLAGSG